MMETEKDLIMMYQTTLRNVGLYTSISFAVLGYSRYYRKKDQLYNVYPIIMSIIFLGTSLLITKFLLDDTKYYMKKIKTTTIEKWLIIPRILYYFNLGLLGMSVLTLVREFGFI